MMSTVVPMADGKVRLNNDELKRRVAKAIYEGDIVLFDSLPKLVADVIEHKVWESFDHDNFADFALDHTSHGLGVNTNQRLWILRCAMDAHGKHIQEWADVLAKVEEMVKLVPVSERGSTKYMEGNSLESLAKNETTLSQSGKITYLPSKQKSTDGALLRLRKNHPDRFQQVIRGETTARKAMTEARKAAGIKTGNESNLVRAKSVIGKLTDDEWNELVAWLKDTGRLS